MGASVSSDAPGVTHITDVTKVEKEQIVFDWTILDFDPGNLNFQAKSSTFQAGDRLGRPSQWYLALDFAPERHGCINAGLYLETAVPALDMPKDITTRIDLSLLDEDGKTFREFGHATKTFDVPFFGGPQTYLDCYEWKHVIDLDTLTKEKNPIFSNSGGQFNSIPHLHLRLKMEIHGKFVSSVAIRGPMWMTENLKVHYDYSTSRPLWITKENTDCIIKCQSLSLKAHTNILKSRSRVFETMLKPGLRQIDHDNGNRIILPVDDMEPKVLETMLRYMYIGNLDGIPWNMETYSGLINAADQFELHSLKSSCFIQIIFNMNATNAGDIAVIAHRNCACNEIKCQISDFIRLHWVELENMDGFYKLVQEQPLAFAFFHLPIQPSPPQDPDLNSS